METIVIHTRVGEAVKLWRESEKDPETQRLLDLFSNGKKVVLNEVEADLLIKSGRRFQSQVNKDYFMRYAVGEYVAKIRASLRRIKGKGYVC